MDAEIALFELHVREVVSVLFLVEIDLMTGDLEEKIRLVVMEGEKMRREGRGEGGKIL